MSTICYIPTVEYYSAIKGNEVLMHVTMWMSAENVMLSKDARHLHEMSRTVKSIEAESQ